MYVKKELSVYRQRKGIYLKKLIGLGYRLDHKLLFGPPSTIIINDNQHI